MLLLLHPEHLVIVVALFIHSFLKVTKLVECLLFLVFIIFYFPFVLVFS